MATFSPKTEQDVYKTIFDPARDFPAVRMTMPYLIMSSPRCGSTMLASALRATGLAGDPLEYLNRRVLGQFVKHTGETSFDAYMVNIVRRRTSPNGVFGIKVHDHQYSDTFAKSPPKGVAWLRNFRRFIFITREDRISQAISWMLARERDIWNTENAGDVMPERGYREGDEAKIDAFLAGILKADAFWSEIIAGNELRPVARVTYERLLADPRGEVARVLEFLGVRMPAGDVPLATTVKIAGEGSREIRREYLKRSGRAAA